MSVELRLKLNKGAGVGNRPISNTGNPKFPAASVTNLARLVESEPCVFPTAQGAL